MDMYQIHQKRRKGRDLDPQKKGKEERTKAR
jgi:hypothetical protein